MKKIITLALLAGGIMTASAQFIATTPGKVLTYECTAKTDDGEKTFEEVSTLKDVVKGEDGVVKFTFEDVAPTPGTLVGKTTTYSYYTFNPADNTTTVLLSGEEQTKSEFIEMVKQQAAAEGSVLTDSQIAEIEKSIKVKGELTLQLKPDMAPGTKAKNQSVRLHLGPTVITTNLWENVFVGKESITVPAGTFDCVKITFLQRQSAGGEVHKSYYTQWYAEGVGAVRTDVSEKKGGEPMLTIVLKSIGKAE